MPIHQRYNTSKLEPKENEHIHEHMLSIEQIDRGGALPLAMAVKLRLCAMHPRFAAPSALCPRPNRHVLAAVSQDRDDGTGQGTVILNRSHL
jgi:hypothetical protein